MSSPLCPQRRTGNTLSDRLTQSFCNISTFSISCRTIFFFGVLVLFQSHHLSRLLSCASCLAVPPAPLSLSIFTVENLCYSFVYCSALFVQWREFFYSLFSYVVDFPSNIQICISIIEFSAHNKYVNIMNKSDKKGGSDTFNHHAFFVRCIL